MIVGATILCDRKASSQTVGLRALAAMDGIAELYVNVETNHTESWLDMRMLLAQQQKPWTIEGWYREGWKDSKPEFDQDQKRLPYIVAARNMCIDYALSIGAEWLLFVDADVMPQPDGIRHLLEIDQPLVGGLVPGRGIHGFLHYVFPGEVGITESEKYIRCGHGTCGYMLIHRMVFSRLRFRWGYSNIRGDVWRPEDPAYCEDARKLGLADAFYISKRATATHWDDPKNPLTNEGVCTENFQRG